MDNLNEKAKLLYKEYVDAKYKYEEAIKRAKKASEQMELLRQRMIQKGNEYQQFINSYNMERRRY